MIFIYALAILHMTFNPLNWLPRRATNGHWVRQSECSKNENGFSYVGYDREIGFSPESCFKAYEIWQNQYSTKGFNYGARYVIVNPYSKI